MKRKTVMKFGVVFLCAWGALAWALDRWGQSQRAQKADAIVVLGARVVPPGVAGIGLRARAAKAAELFHAGVAPNIICTGGVGETAPAESLAAAQVLRMRKVPARAIHIETVSTSTWENAEKSAAICRRNDWTRVVVVSAPFHLWRASRNFRRAGLQVTTSPAPNAAFRFRAVGALRESVLVVRDALLFRL